MKTIVWCDVDGVLLDFLTPFLEHTGLAEKGFTAENVKDYDFSLLFSNKEESDEAIRDFTKSEAYNNLSTIASLLDLEALKNIGFELRAITQVDGDNIARVNRIKNLTSKFSGLFNGIYFTKPGQCKLDVISTFAGDGERHIIIEDNPALLTKLSEEVLRQIQTHGNSCLLGIGITHRYNAHQLRDLDGIVTVRDFSQATEMLLIGHAQNYAS